MVRPRNERGAILLLVLLVGSILFVIVGQFSRSMVLDRVLAQNHLRDAQVRCDMKSAAALFKAAVSRGEAESPVSFSLPSGIVSLAWTDESGKYNINNLRSEDVNLATQQLDRLFGLLEAKNIVTVLGLSGAIADFVLVSERPILSLGELKQIDGVTEEVLRGLEPYLTVYSDGLVNFNEAPTEVLSSLTGGVGSARAVEQLKQKLENPGAKVPGAIAGAANRIRKNVSADARAYRARIRLEGDFAVRDFEVAVRREDGRFRTVLFNELEESHERFDE